MSVQLNQREKVLGSIVGGVVLIFVSLYLFQFFTTNHSRLKTDFNRKRAQITAMQALLNDSALWAERDAWLKAHQPVLENERTVSSEFLKYVQEVAQKHTVLIESPKVLGPEKRPHCTAVVVYIETKSLPKDLLGFLREMQGPEQFIVFESAKLEVDQQDQKQMKGIFNVAKWYAPK